MTTAERIKQRRLELGLTQLEVAKRMGLTTKAAVCKIEKQGNDVTLKSVEKFALALNCAPAYLMGWSDEKYDEPGYKGQRNNASVATVKGTVVVDTSETLKPETEDEKELQDLYSQLTTEQQQLVRNTMKAFLQKQ
jgi:transcriptional regulator with XRE-family HTH domain